MSQFSILHLSDAHIGSPLWKTDMKTVMAPLIRDIEAVSKNRTPELIIFSGDLVQGDWDDKALTLQYEAATEWLDSIHKIWGKSIGQIPILFVPGNHDVQRSAVDEMQTSWLHSVATAESIDAAAKTNSKLWQRITERQEKWWKFVKAIPNQRWDYNDVLKLSHQKFNVDGVSMGIVGFNTSWSSSENKEKAKLWLGEHQFQFGSQTISDCDIKIAVMHHPYSWFREEEERWLNSKFETHFELVLQGHIHSNWYTSQQKHVLLSAGACYAGSKNPNGYYWISIDVAGRNFEISARAYQNVGKGEWIPLYIPDKYNLQGIINLPFGKSEEKPKELSIEELENDAVIVGTSDIAASFPAPIDPFIERPEEIEDLLENFNSSSRLLLVTGDENVGKSTFVSQIVRRFPNLSVSVFLNKAPHWADQLSYIKRDLSNQIHWLVTGKEAGIEKITDATFATYLHKLRRFAQGKRQMPFVVIDGLNQFTSSKEKQIISDVLSLFGLFFTHFNYVVTLQPELLPSEYKTLGYQTYRVSRFSEKQTLAFFSGIVPEERAKEIWSLTNGHPAALASIRRILKKEPNLAVQNLPIKLPDLLEREWRQVNVGNSNQLKIVAAVALFPGKFNSERLTSILKVPQPEVEYALQTLPFFQRSGQENYIVFTSEILREFVAAKTKSIESSIENSIREDVIEDLLKSPTTIEALQEIPLHFHQTGKFKELASYLTPEHLQMLLQRSQSWYQAIDKVDLAFSSSFQKEQLQEYARFALHKGALVELQRASPGEGEIAALLALTKWDEAITLAESQIAKENQLLLFAKVSRAAKEKQYILPLTVVESIQSLVKDVQLHATVDQKMDIAAELVHSYPDLAIRVVESMSGTQEDIDSALASVSIQALVGKDKDAVIEDAITDISAKIGDERARKFAIGSQLVFGNYSSSAALNRVKTMANPKDQIFLLRQWLIRNTKSPDVLPTVEYALDLVVKTSDYVLTAPALRELTAPLPYVAKDYRVLVIVTRVSDQITRLKNKGFTKDYVQLQLILIQTEALYADENYKERMSALYYYVAEVEDLSIRTYCYAAMCVKIKEFEHVTDRNFSYSMFISDLESSYKQLLITTADHYIAAKDAIVTIHEVDADLSLRLVSQINTEPRRNQLYSDLARVESRSERFSVRLIEEVLKRITYKQLADRTIALIIEYLATTKKTITSEGTEMFKRLSEQISDPLTKCSALKDFLKILGEHDPELPAGYEDDVNLSIFQSWSSIDDSIAKKECGYEIAATLAAYNLQIANHYYNAAQQLHSDQTISDAGFSETIFYSIYLAIRFYRGLIIKNLASNNDRKEIISRITRISSLSKRLELFAELANAHLICNRNSQEASAIALEQITPLLDNIILSSESLYENAFIEVAPCLYLTHSPSTRQKLQRLKPYMRDAALVRIGLFILQKNYPDDPFNAGEHHNYNLTFLEVSELIEVLTLLENDSWIYWFITAIVDNCTHPRSKRSFNQTQITEVVTQLQKVVENQLPNPAFIAHAGYKIASLAQISRLTAKGEDIIRELFSDARNIANIADRSFVLALLASALPSNRNELAKNTFNEALAITEQITTFEDRVEHYHSIADLAQDSDKSIARAALKQASTYVLAVENWRGRAQARRLVDAAHRIDESWAEEVAKILDGGTATTALTKVHSEVLYERKLRSKISQEGSPLDAITGKDLDILSRIAWKMLGDINAHNDKGVKLARCRDLIKAASQMSFQKSYNVWLFIAENLVDQYQNTPQAELYLRQMFQSALDNSDLTYGIAASGSSIMKSSIDEQLQEYQTGTSIITAGSRQKALDTIQQWCATSIRNYILIVDPSFRLDDLSLIELIRRTNEGCNIIVLSSKSVQHLAEGSSTLEESYKAQWRKIASNAESGTIEIVFVAASLTGDLPIDARMLITEQGGLWFSSGFSQLGIGVTATIRRMSLEEAKRNEEDLEKYIDGRRSAGGQQFSSSRFTLH